MQTNPTNSLSLPADYPELLAEIGHILRGQLPNASDAELFAVLEAIRHGIGGTQVYVPKGMAFDLTERDAAIYAQYTGSNYHGLAVAYSLTTHQLRQIIQRHRVAEKALHTQPATANPAPAPQSVHTSQAQTEPHPQTPQSPADQTAAAQPPHRACGHSTANSPAAPAAPQTPLVLLVPPHWAGTVSFQPFIAC